MPKGRTIPSQHWACPSRSYSIVPIVSPFLSAYSCINLYKVYYDVQENEVAVDAVF